MSQMKADIAIQKFQTAMQKAVASAPEMKGRLLKNLNTDAVFAWTPAASIESYMQLVSLEEQKAMLAGVKKAPAARK